MAARADRWRDNWRAVGAPGAVRVELGRRAPRGHLEVALRGTEVVVSASAPGALRRCRTFARRAGIQVEREYLALPSAAAPCYLVEDASAPVRFFLERVLAPPARPAIAMPVVAALRLLPPWRLVRRLAPGRVIVGRCV